MTNLTEQNLSKKNGKTFFYIKFPNGEVIQGDEFALGLYRMCKDGDKVEMLEQVPSYEQWKEKDDTLTSLLAEYGKLTKELQDEKEKHMTRPSLRSPLDEVVIEKKVYESTLNRSMVLQAENEKLKELLKDARNVLKMVDTYYGDYDSTKGFLIVERIDEVIK